MIISEKRNVPLPYIETCRAPRDHNNTAQWRMLALQSKSSSQLCTTNHYYPRCTTRPFTQIALHSYYIYIDIYIYIIYPHSWISLPNGWFLLGLASTSTLPTLPSSFSGTSFDTSSVSCASASSQKRALRQPMRLAGQLRLGCVSDRGLTMLMKVFCTWPNGCLFLVPLLFWTPGRFRRLRCHVVWKVVKSKEPFFFKTAKASGWKMF